MLLPRAGGLERDDFQGSNPNICMMLQVLYEYPFDHFRSTVLAMPPASFLCPSLVAEHGKVPNL